jgi:hypothetical protein
MQSSVPGNTPPTAWALVIGSSKPHAPANKHIHKSTQHKAALRVQPSCRYPANTVW